MTTLETALAARMAEHTAELHRRTREHTLIRAALTRLRAGEHPAKVKAGLEAEGVEVEA
jgi:hypothetical protein